MLRLVDLQPMLLVGLENGGVGGAGVRVEGGFTVEEKAADFAFEKAAGVAAEQVALQVLFAREADGTLFAEMGA